MFSDLKKIDKESQIEAEKKASRSPIKNLNANDSVENKEPEKQSLNAASAQKTNKSKVEEKPGNEEGVNDVTTSLLQDVSLREWKDIVENTETHNSSLRLTNDEVYEVEDLINELRRNLKVKTSLNEVARLGLLYIIHDFKKKRKNSLVYKVKKS